MKFWQTVLTASVITMMTTVAQAGIVVGGTRLVYDGAKKEASLNLRNPDKGPYLIQSWVDISEESTEKAPFVVTPPLFRLDAEQRNILRIIRAGGNLPEDRESLFWINVKSIPSVKPLENTLQIAVKTRIKMFFRPAAISKTKPSELAEQLTWTRSGNTLEVNNPTPYHFTFHEIKVGNSPVQKTSMVSPMSSATFALPSGASGSAVEWKYINDYGGVSQAISYAL